MSETVTDPMLAGLDTDLNAQLQEELKHLQIPVQPTNAEHIGTATEPGAEPKPGETATDTNPKGPGADTGNQPPPPPHVNEPPPPGPTVDDPAKRKRNAVRYAKMNDLTMSTVLSMVKNIAREKLIADNDELANLVDAWEDFLMENQDFKIPGYVQLIIANAVIYGIKAFGADLMNLATGAKPKAESAPKPERPQAQENGNQPPPPQGPQPAVTIIRTPEPQPQRSNNTPGEIVKYEDVKPHLHKCALPGCDKQIPKARKFCGKSHSTMWQNYTLRGVAIDPEKI